MARRGGGGGGGMSAWPMNTIIAGFVGLLVIVAIVILGPVLAGSMQGAVTIPNGTCTYTNASLTTPVQYGECGTQNVTFPGDAPTYNTAFDSWNSDFNTDIPTGESIWTTNVVIGGVVVLVFFIALAIFYIRVIA